MPNSSETTKTIAKKAPQALRGRPKGAKNKTTIFKEAMQQGFEDSLRKDFPKVLEAVIDKATKGDMKAAKLLLDRVVPVSRAVDLDTVSKGGLAINITVGSMEENQPTIIEGKVNGDSE